MALTWTKEGRTNIWDIIGGTNGNYFEIHLYSNAITWDDATTEAMLVEANYGGYAPAKGLTWSAPVEVVGGDLQITSPVFVFTHGPATDSGVVTGYYVKSNDGITSDMLAGEAFAASLSMSAPTDQIPLQISLSLRALLA
jgi:hypothetical protein